MKAEARLKKSRCRNRYNSQNQLRQSLQIWVLKTVVTGTNCSKVIAAALRV